MALIERFTPGGNIYPDGSSTFAMLGEFFRRLAENRDAQDLKVVADAQSYTDETAAPVNAGLQSTLDTEALFSITDEDGRRSWLEVAADGGPTPHSAGKIAPTVAPVVAEQVGIADMDTGLNGLSVAIVDEDGRRSWLEADEAGGPTPHSLELLRSGLALAAPLTTTVVCSGDSMTGGASGTPYPAHLASLTGWSVINDGVGGESSTTIAGRMGGRPMLVSVSGGTIPASGPVTVTLASDDGVDTRGPTPLLQQQGGTNPVRIAGVEGTLTVDKTVTPPGYTFTRSTAGTTVAVNYPTPLVTYAMREHNAGVHVMWWGTNDVPVTNNDATHIIARQRALLHHHIDDKPRYLVLGLTVQTGAWRAPMNQQFLREFGRRFVDLGTYLSHPAALEDAGLTPTAADTAAQAEGKVPPALLVDPTHLNDTGNLLVARRVAARIREMGWLS